MIATREWIAPGRRGTHQTLARIEEMVQTGKRDMRFRQAVITQALRHAPERDPDAEIAAIVDWIQRRTRYVHDPAGIELVQDPAITVGIDGPGGVGAGDCDDFVAATRAGLEVVGYPTRSKVIGRTPDTYHHIFLEVHHPRRGWRPIDPIAKTRPLGWAPTSTYSEVYPMRAPSSQLTGPRALSFAELRRRGRHPELTMADPETLAILAQMKGPGNDWGLRGQHDLGLGQFDSYFRNQVAPSGALLTNGRFLFRPDVRTGQLGDLAGRQIVWRGLQMEAGRSISADAQAKWREAFRHWTPKPATSYTTGSQHEVNLQAHWETEALVHKYGGGAHFAKLPCGPHACIDIVHADKHPWIRDQQVEAAHAALASGKWSTDILWGGTNNLWEGTGHFNAYAFWLWALDVKEGEIQGIPPGYVTDAKGLIAAYLRGRAEHVKKRMKRLESQAKTKQIVGLALAPVTLALSSIVLGPSSLAIAGPIAGQAAKLVQGKVGKELGQIAQTEAKAKQLAAVAQTLNETVPAVVRDLPGATTGMAEVDQLVRSLVTEVEQLKAQELTRQALATPAYTGPQVPVTPVSWSPYGVGVPAARGVPGWVWPVAIAAGLVVITGVGFLAMRR